MPTRFFRASRPNVYVNDPPRRGSSHRVRATRPRPRAGATRALVGGPEIGDRHRRGRARGGVEGSETLRGGTWRPRRAQVLGEDAARPHRSSGCLERPYLGVEHPRGVGQLRWRYRHCSRRGSEQHRAHEERDEGSSGSCSRHSSVPPPSRGDRLGGPTGSRGCSRESRPPSLTRPAKRRDSRLRAAMDEPRRFTATARSFPLDRTFRCWNPAPLGLSA